MSMHMRMHMHVHMIIFLCAHMSTHMSTHMSAYMFMQMPELFGVNWHVYRHVYRHVCRHVCTHVHLGVDANVSRRGYGHVCRHLYGHSCSPVCCAMDMCADVCIWTCVACQASADTTRVVGDASKPRSFAANIKIKRIKAGGYLRLVLFDPAKEKTGTVPWLMKQKNAATRSGAGSLCNFMVLLRYLTAPRMVRLCEAKEHGAYAFPCKCGGCAGVVRRCAAVCGSSAVVCGGGQ